MAEQQQRIQLEGASRATIDISGSDLTVGWRDDIEEIIASGQELSVDRAGDEVFLRAERRGRGRGGGLFDLLPNISTPGVKIDWSGEGSSIEVSDEEGVKIRTGLGRGEGSSGRSVIQIDLPVAVSVTSIEVESGDLELDSPAGKVESQVKTGNMRSSGGDAEMTASLGSGNARIKNLDGSLHVMGGSGDVEIRDCRTITNVKAGSGEVSLSNVNGEAISLMAGSGDVEVRACEASAFSCQTGSGDIGIQGGDLERINVRSGSGDVDCSALFGPHTQSFMTGSGSVSLGIPRGLPIRFEVATQGGEIDSDIQLVSVGQRGPRSRRTRRQVGSVGTGEPRAEVSVRTSSGDISLYWLRSQAHAPASGTLITVPPQQPAPPKPPASATPADDQDSGDTGRDAGVSGEQDQRTAILESLARGEISVDEADLLLRHIETGNQD